MTSTLIYSNGKKIKKKDPYEDIYRKYKDLYKRKYFTEPEVCYGVCGRLIKQRLKNHSVKGLIRIIELYFENEKGNTVYDLKTILSAYYINKYSPKIKLDPRLYSNAEEHNKEVY